MESVESQEFCGSSGREIRVCGVNMFVRYVGERGRTAFASADLSC